MSRKLTYIEPLLGEKMNYKPVPSLERVALIRTAIALWNQDDIRTFLANFNHRHPIIRERREKWQKLEDKVTAKVQQLPQPRLLQRKILGCIKPIGLEILKWIDYHNNVYSQFVDEDKIAGINLESELAWTPLGTVDVKRTAEILIKDERLDISYRYKLACVYCLEDDILELWKKLPETEKRFLHRSDPRELNQHELVLFWTYDIMGEAAKLSDLTEIDWGIRCSPYQYVFESPALIGNKRAIEYFLQKITSEERQQWLASFTGYVVSRHASFDHFHEENHADVLRFLFSQMNQEEEAEVCRNYPFPMLYCFLAWPCQQFFMEMARRTWAFLSKRHFGFILWEIVAKVIEGYRDYDYRTLFGEFWRESPISHRNCVIAECAGESLLSELLLSVLFQVEDREYITLILKDASTLEREKIIFSNQGKRVCESLMYNGKTGLLKFFIQECISSKDLMKFKEELRKRVTRERSKKILDRWREFSEVLDDLIENGF